MAATHSPARPAIPLARGSKHRRRRRAFPITVIAANVALALTTSSGCVRDEGVVEINWKFVDRELTDIYPGERMNSCAFTGQLDESGAQEFGLHVELSICDPRCEGDCASGECVIQTQRFPCKMARATTSVPMIEEREYTFATHILAAPSGADIEDPATCTCTLLEECALTPGPRDRILRPGLVTDLQVYQFVLPTLALPVDLDPIPLDLSSCCEFDPECP